VLIGTPIVAWTLLQGQWRTVWQRFFWIRGALLTAALALPWYVAAELRNPGFLQYFIVGEHLGRFLQPGWSGDLYGRAHDVPRGTIWLFLLIGALPWSLLVVPALIRARAAVASNWRERRGLIVFAALAALTPQALFTLAGNIIFPYALPALPLTVVACVALISDARRPGRWLGITAAAAAASALALAVLAQVFAARIDQESQRAVVAAGAELLGEPGDEIYYWRNRYFSAEYYSGGRAQTVDDAGAVTGALRAGRKFLLVVDVDQIESLPAELRDSVERVDTIGEQALFEPGYAVPVAPRAADRP
jgi:4-amino-4-deoxy-L-arabinose transferase-like glycosyltransferase